MKSYCSRFAPEAGCVFSFFFFSDHKQVHCQFLCALIMFAGVSRACNFVCLLQLNICGFFCSHLGHAGG